MRACVRGYVSECLSVFKQRGSQCVHGTAHMYAMRTCFYFSAAQAPSTLRRFHAKVSIFISSKAKNNNFVHTSILVSFSLVHTKMLESDENDWDLGLHLCRCSDLEWS